MKTKFYVYKIDGAYLKISNKPKEKVGESMFITTLVKDINEASLWSNKKSAKSWTVEKMYPAAKLTPCGLCEMK
jgi:hypothetical protein